MKLVFSGKISTGFKTKMPEAGLSDSQVIYEAKAMAANDDLIFLVDVESPEDQEFHDPSGTGFVITGSIIDGITVIGPLTDLDDANTYADKYCEDQDYHVFELSEDRSNTPKFST